MDIWRDLCGIKHSTCCSREYSRRRRFSRLRRSRVLLLSAALINKSFSFNNPHYCSSVTKVGASALSWLELRSGGGDISNRRSTASTWLLRSATSSSPSSSQVVDADRRFRDVAFASPLLDYGYPPVVEDHENRTLSKKPLLLYLPGFDATELCPFLQFPELSTVFDVRCLTMGVQDRSTFDELRDDVIAFIQQQIQRDPLLLTTIIRQPIRNHTDNNNNNNNNNINIDNINRTPNATSSQEVKENASSFSVSSSFVNMFKFMGGVGRSYPKPDLPVTTTTTTDRPVYLVGESFGSLLACEVALALLNGERRLSNLKGLVLINAATCYDRSKLAAEAPVVANLPPLLYPFGLLKLLPLFGDDFSWAQLMLILQSKYLPSVIDTPEREAYMGRVAFSLPRKLQYMPQATLQWRLDQWLDVGCARMESRLGEFREFRNNNNFRLLVVAAERDWALPSIAEAERLASVFPDCQVHVVEGAGHASTCGSRVDLCALLRARFAELRSLTTTTTTTTVSSSTSSNTNSSTQHNTSSSTTNNNNNNNSNLLYNLLIPQLPWRSTAAPRTAMKETAAKNKGVLFGMEPRYNGKEVGLPIWRYWSKELYRKVQRQSLNDEHDDDDEAMSHNNNTVVTR